MALQVGEALLHGLGHELGVQVGGSGAEGHVHEGAGVLLGSHGEELGVVQHVVEHVGLGDVDLLHAGGAALLLQPVAHQAEHIDAPAGRGVVHGVLVDHVLVVHDGRGDGQLVASQVLPDDGDGQASGSQVLLGTGEDDAVLAHVHGTGQDVGGHVADQRHAVGLRDVLPLGALDGVVGAVIEVGGVGAQLQVALGGDIGVLAVLGGGGDVDLTVLLGFLHGEVCEVAGHSVVGLAGLADQVHGDHAKLHGAATLQEQDFIALRHVHQLAELGLGVVKDLLEDLGAVAHLHDGHTGAVVVGDLSACTLEDLQRQHGRASGEVKYTIVSHRN